MASSKLEEPLLSDESIKERASQALATFAEIENSQAESLNLELLERVIRGHSTLVSSEVVTTHEPPSVGGFPDLIAWAGIEQAGKKGVSVWIGNIRFNFKDAVTAAAQGAIGVSTPLPPWAYLLSALLAICQIDNLTKVPLAEPEASVLYTMWLRSDAWRQVPVQGLDALVNSDRASHGRSALSRADFDNAISLLKRIRLIELDEAAGAWRLLDEIRVTRKRNQ